MLTSLMMDNKHSARQTIERMIADWDRAYADSNPHGIVGHFVPQEHQRVEECRQAWEGVMDWTEDQQAHTTIREFCFDGIHATVIAEQTRRFCFRHPLPTYALGGRVLLAYLSRFVFVEHESSRLEWNSTPEGWLCASEKRLSYRLRVQRRTSMAKREQSVL